jgi:hypothetical protein
MRREGAERHPIPAPRPGSWRNRRGADLDGLARLREVGQRGLRYLPEDSLNLVPIGKQITYRLVGE